MQRKALFAPAAILAGIVLVLVGIFRALPLFRFPPDDRSAHLASIELGLLSGIGLALICYALYPRLRKVPWSKTLLYFPAALAVAMSISCLLMASAHDGTGKAHFLRLLGGTIGGISIGLALSGVWEATTRAFESAWFYVAAAVASLALLFGIHWCGMRQFGGFDHSMVVDFGWRLLAGQHATIDFPATAPASFFMGAYYAYALFGLKWESLILACALFSVLMFVWMLWLLPQFISNRWECFLIALSSQALCVLPVSYWWYNPVSTSIGVVFAVAAYAWLLKPERFALALSYGLALFLVASIKPNIAGLLILPITIILLTSARHRIPVIAVSVIAFATFTEWLTLNHISLFALLKDYLSVSGRAFEAGPFFADPRGFEALLAIITLGYVMLPLASVFSSSWLRSWRRMGIALFATLAGLDNFLAAGETKLVDTGLVLAGIVLVAHAMGRWTREDIGPGISYRFTERYLILVTLVTICAGTAVAATRHRVRGIGPGMFFEYNLRTKPFGFGYFQGMRTGPRFHSAYAELASTVQTYSGRSIFLGPRMQWGYAAFGLPSPVHQPVWWHPGTSFGMDDLFTYVRTFQQAKYDVLIFLKNDMTFYPADLVDWIKNNYVADEAFSELSIYHSRSLPDSGAVADRIEIVDDELMGRTVTTEVSLNVPTVPPGGEYGTKVRLPGVQATDQLLLSPTQYSGSWGVYYYSTDTVTVNYTNTTTASKDPPPLNFRVTAVQISDRN